MEILMQVLHSEMLMVKGVAADPIPWKGLDIQPNLFNKRMKEDYEPIGLQYYGH